MCCEAGQATRYTEAQAMTRFVRSPKDPGSDSLHGDEGDDRLAGGAGDDLVTVGEGNDDTTGGGRQR